jgi:hypothetical protein
MPLRRHYHHFLSWTSGNVVVQAGRQADTARRDPAGGGCDDIWSPDLSLSVQKMSSKVQLIRYCSIIVVVRMFSYRGSKHPRIVGSVAKLDLENSGMMNWKLGSCARYERKTGNTAYSGQLGRCARRSVSRLQSTTRENSGLLSSRHRRQSHMDGLRCQPTTTPRALRSPHCGEVESTM